MGLVKLKEDINELKTQNENLRISLRTYSQKPGRKRDGKTSGVPASS